MHIQQTQKLTIVLALLLLLVFALTPTTASAQSAPNYISHLCPGDIVQGEVLWNGMPPLAEVFNEFPNFANADRYTFGVIQGGIVLIEVHRLTSAMNPAAAVYLGYGDGPLIPKYAANTGAAGSVHGVGGFGNDVSLPMWNLPTGVYTLAVWDELGAGPGPNVPYDIHISGDGVAPCNNILTINIDIKPDSQNNTVNINGNGVIPVVILGSDSFQVNQIDVSTVKFAGLDVRVKGNGSAQCSFQDANADGFTDLVCQFVDDPTGWSPDNGTASVTGNLLPVFGGTAFQGTDIISLVQQ